MDLIREWITSLAGVIAIAAICDIIMIDGEMKKYLKPILGFVIIVTVAKPIAGIGNDISFDIPEVSAEVSTDFSAEIDELEQKNIAMLYQQKLAEQVENELRNFSQDCNSGCTDGVFFLFLEHSFIIFFHISTHLLNCSPKYSFISSDSKFP